MKRLLLVGFFITNLLSISVHAQTQQQKVKVRTRVTADLKGGAPIAGAEVKFVGGNRHTSGQDGMFSFTVRGKFEIESASKQGYVMIDPKYLKGFTSYTPDAIPVIMEERNKLNRETERQTQRINKQLYDENERLMRLNDSLLAAKSITEARYDSLEQARSSDYLSKMDKVRDMAEAFANIDYGILEEYDRKVYKALSEGDYDKAYKLLRSHKSVEELKKEIDAASAAIGATEEMLAAAKQGRDAKIKEAADQCYRWFEYYKSRFMSDSAAYYLKQRADLDTNCYSWQKEAGCFCADNSADYNNAMKYFVQSLHSAQRSHDTLYEANSYSNIGSVYHQTGDYEKAYNNYLKALELFKKQNNNQDTNIASCYNNIATYYYDNGIIDTAILYYSKALETYLKYCGEIDPSVALCYNNLGYIYEDLGLLDTSLYLYNKSLEIRKVLYGEYHVSLVESYLNLGAYYGYRGDSVLAFQYFGLALSIAKQNLGENNPLISKIMNNYGYMYSETEQYEKALDMYSQSLSIKKRIYGESHPSIAQSYRNIGEVYKALEKYNEALRCDTIALNIQKKFFDENNPEIAITYHNLASTYSHLGETNRAITSYKKAIKIWTHIYGEKHIYIGMGYANLGILYYDIDDFDKSLECFNLSISAFPDGHPDIQTIKQRKKEVEDVIMRINKEKK